MTKFNLVDNVVAKPVLGMYVLVQTIAVGTMRRINKGEACWDESMNSHWGLFDNDGKLIDHDQYRHDLASRSGFTIERD